MLKLLLLPAVLVPERFRKYRLASVYLCLLLVIFEFIFLIALLHYLRQHPDVALEQTVKKWLHMLK